MPKPTTLKAIPYAGESPPLGDNFLKSLRLTVVYRPLRDLVPNKRNARTHSDAQVAQIAASIREFGIVSPVAVDESGGLWAGHAVCLAAAKEGYDQVPTVDISHLTPLQRRAYALAANKIAQNAGWDDNMLGLELSALQMDGFNLDLLGFNEAELNNLLPAVEGEGDGEGNPELPAVPVTKPGDTWLLGTHRVRCGDSCDQADVTALLAGETPFLMVTDPPYGVDYSPAWREGMTRANGTKVLAVSGGKVVADDNADWTPAWLLFPGDVAYVWHGDQTDFIVQKSLRDAGFEKRATIIWNKGKAPPSRGHYHFQHEACFYMVRVGRKGHWNGDRKQSTVWDIGRNNGFEAKKDEGTADEHSAHSTQKPVECMKRPILNNSKKGDAVYDPFLGSGTTIVAGERTGRRIYGMEINPGYVDIAVARWEKESGRKATLDGSTMTFDDVRKERLGAGSG